MAKLKASELAKRTTLEAMQMMGGSGTPPSTGWSIRCALPW